MEENPEEKAHRDQLTADLSDIKALRSMKSDDPFNRYFMRRIRQKLAASTKAFKYEPPTKVDSVQREALRQVNIAYEELLNMLETEEGVALKSLDQILLKARQRQSGVSGLGGH